MLSIILGGDKQWLVRVSTVAGVVVLRTLLQVRRGECALGLCWEKMLCCACRVLGASFVLAP